MHGFINHISPDQYWFTGLFSDQSSGTQRPLVVTGSFLNHEGRLLLEGTYRLAQGETSHRFSLRVLSFGYLSVPIEIEAAHLGKLRGYWHSIGGAHEVLATGPTGSAFSAHIQEGPNASLRVSGTLIHAGVSLGYFANGAPGEERSDLGNVVRVSGGRRA